MKKSIKALLVFVSISTLLVAFQNCGESLDLATLTAASTEPSVSLATSGSTEMVENSSYKLDLQIRNIEDYTIQWWKDGAALIGFDGESLIFEPAQLIDAGEYYATVRIDLTTELQTDPVIVTVTADATLSNYTLPRVINGANTYYLASGTLDQNQATANAYCQRELGATAITTGFATNSNTETINYTAKAETQAACGALPYISGMCLRFDRGIFEPELREFFGPFVRRFASVTCRPQPIQGLGI